MYICLRFWSGLRWHVKLGIFSIYLNVYLFAVLERPQMARKKLRVTAKLSLATRSQKSKYWAA